MEATKLEREKTIRVAIAKATEKKRYVLQVQPRGGDNEFNNLRSLSLESLTYQIAHLSLTLTQIK